MLYPFKFKHIYKDKIWGGTRFAEKLNRKDCQLQTAGESWEISAVEDNISVVSNGFLKGNNLQDLIEIYMDEIVGQKVYEKFGIEFPLLIKFIDSNDALSVQVHPNDEVAKERHKAYGKTEMWYIMDAEKDSSLIVGFEKDSSMREFSDAIQNQTVPQILHTEPVAPGDVFFLPAGRVHAIGKGILLAEIQQTSDITYRIFDWNRVDANGKGRELHLNLAMDVIDYKAHDSYKTDYMVQEGGTSEILTCKYFQTNILSFDMPITKDYYHLDSFVIYMCLDGEATINFKGDYEEQIVKGETVLIPASLHDIVLTPKKATKLLEVFIP